MEKQFLGIKENITRKVTILAGALALTCILTACPSGQTDPPTISDINKYSETFILNGVTAGDGGPVYCKKYASETSNTNDSKSWFSVFCDFAGTATFDEEPTPISATTTTIG